MGSMVAAFGAAVALADDPDLQQRLSWQRARDARAGRGPTIALYAGRKGVSGATKDSRPELRLEVRTNANGQTMNLYAPAR